MSLLVTYPPQPDESGLGYYRRLAADNVLSGWRELAGLASVQISRNALLGHSDFVAGQLGLEHEWAHIASEQDVRARAWGRLQRIQADAVCPDCLVEGGYLRHHWAHMYVTACPKHRIQLVDHCNECGEALSPQRPQISQCECGHDLHGLPRRVASPAQLWLSALIATGSSEVGSVGPRLTGVELDALRQVVSTLCLSSEPTRPVLHRSMASPTCVAEAVAFLAPLEVFLEDWPEGFRSHVERRIEAGNPDARTLNALLGPWYVGLRKVCQGTALELFLRIIIEVAAERFDGILGLDSAKAMAENLTDHVRSADAAKAIGVSPSRLHKSIQAGECRYRTRRFGTRGQLFEIPCEEVARIQLRRREWVSEAEACELAGVPPAVLEPMMASGVIRSDVRWREDILKGGPVQERSIHELFERIRGSAEQVPVFEDEAVTWAGMTSRRMGDKQAIQAAMRAISDGQVRAINRGRRLGEMQFSRDEVAAYFGTPLLEAGMSIQQLSKLTGWKWESIANWIETGLLASRDIMHRGRPCRVVLPHHLLAFRQTYVPLADLARGMGTKSSALLRLLPGIELVGAKQLPGGAVRGGLVQIAELGRLAIIGAKAGHDLFVPA